MVAGIINTKQLILSSHFGFFLSISVHFYWFFSSFNKILCGLIMSWNLNLKKGLAIWLWCIFNVHSKNRDWVCDRDIDATFLYYCILIFEMDDERTLQYFLQGLVWYSAIKHAAKTLFQVKFSLLSFTLPLTYNFSMIKKSYKCEDGT